MLNLYVHSSCFIKIRTKSSFKVYFEWDGANRNSYWYLDEIETKFSALLYVNKFLQSPTKGLYVVLNRFWTFQSAWKNWIPFVFLRLFAFVTGQKNGKIPKSLCQKDRDEIIYQKWATLNHEWDYERLRSAGVQVTRNILR